MKPKHTPGPWEAHGDGIICKVARTTTDRVRIAVINGDTETAHADARLIAAAPEMFEVLREVFLMLEELEREGIARQSTKLKVKSALWRARGDIK